MITQITAGVPDLEVCRQFGYLPEDLDRVLERVGARAAALVVEEDAAAMYERALRKRAENAAKSLKARFDALLDASPDAILVVNGVNGIIHQANEVAARLFGFSVRELVGRSMEDLVPERVRRIHPAYRIGFLSNTRKRGMGYHPPIFATRKDGSEVEIAVALTATASDEEVMVVCTESARWSGLQEARAAQDRHGQVSAPAI